MTDSILDSVKKVLGLTPDYTAFDIDVIMHINSVFATLNQLGVGPLEGFTIEDNSTTWGEYIGTDKNLSSVKTYVWLKVRVLFDPPTMSFVLTSYEQQIKELEWRLNVYQEGMNWVNPNSPEATV